MNKNITIICLSIAFFSISAVSLIAQSFEYSSATKKPHNALNDVQLIAHIPDIKLIAHIPDIKLIAHIPDIKLIAHIPDIKLKFTLPESKQSSHHDPVEGVKV
jgi:hypothetical protein